MINTTKLICTRSDASQEEKAKISHPLMEKYALKCKADFLVLNFGLPHGSMYYNNNQGLVCHYRIMKLGELLGVYGRIANFDTDMIINKDAPNIFDFVPEDTIGGVCENIGISGASDQRKDAYIKIMDDTQKEWGKIEWNGKYLNAGMLVVSQQHKNIFTSNNGHYWLRDGTEQTHLAYMIGKHKHKITELSFKWNHMSMFSEPWNNSADRFKSYIIHYAGRGIFDGGSVTDKVMQMQRDYQTIYG
jgi:hypothetical protein